VYRTKRLSKLGRNGCLLRVIDQHSQSVFSHRKGQPSTNYYLIFPFILLSLLIIPHQD